MRGNKNAKSVEEIEADIKQAVGLCQEVDPPGSVTQQRLLPGNPQDPENQHSENYLDITNSKDDKSQEQNEDMSAFRKFVSIVKIQFFSLFLLYKSLVLKT